MDYHFEDILKMKFMVFDVDDKKRIDDTKRHDLIGEMECLLADIVTAGQRYTRNIKLPGAGTLRQQTNCG